MKKRSGSTLFVWIAFSVVFLLGIGCGKNFYFAGRVLPPSGLANRVLIAIQNPGSITRGTLQFVDAYYDVRHTAKDLTQVYSISGFGGALPTTIQNLPERTIGAVYNAGDSSYDLIDYQAERQTLPIPGLPGPSTSILITKDLRYVFAANQQAHSFTVIDRSGGTFYLNLPGIFRVSTNASGTVALGFVENSNAVYTVVHLNAAQQTAAGLSSSPQHFQIGNLIAQDCEPQNLPQYCIFPVSAGSASFDRPTKAIFSADGSSAYVLNCGPECGGNVAGITTIPLTAASFNAVSSGPAGLNLTATTTLAVPGGASNALQNANTLYLAGQQLQPDGLLAGRLSVVDLPSQTIIAGSPYSISDGDHGKMIFADDNTLWIGSTRCLLGERYKLSQTAAGGPFGCLTSFNTATNAVFIDSYKGDLTGEAAVLGLRKLYVAEGGQIHIYNTADGSERDNGNVTVTGTAYDVAYMDAATNGDNTTY